MHHTKVIVLYGMCCICERLVLLNSSIPAVFLSDLCTRISVLYLAGVKGTLNDSALQTANEGLSTGAICGKRALLRANVSQNKLSDPLVLFFIPLFKSLSLSLC